MNALNMNSLLRPVRIGSALLASLLILAGCSVAPTYERPAVDTPVAFKEAGPQAGENGSQWKSAQPSEDIARGEWWKIFNDDSLNALEDRAQHANQDLKAAAARLGQARALTKDARSGYFPQVDAGIGATRQRPSPASQGLPADANTQPFTLYRAQANISYEVDLFGRVASNVDAATADAQRSEALFHSVLLALQADVAQQYFLVRELDAALDLYTGTVKLRQESLRLVQRRFDEGDISEVDVARAKSELASAQSEALGITRQRATAEHALAILLGRTPAEFSLPPRPLTRISLAVPAGLPSTLLERRPDIAAAERSMAAANARVGVAKSAFFPSLNLTGGLGYESSQLGELFNWSSRTFLLGPLVGTALSMPIFDGGRRQAGVDRARAGYEEQVATYRGTVLNAFREVEDNLANLRILGDQSRAQDEAVSASERAAKLSHTQYQEGAVSYFNVIDADRTVLQQQRASVTLDGERARSTVNLIRALGGGWGAAPVAPATPAASTQLSSSQ
ncbi:efflux transporter outer membrane subunit [Herbaspirillum sp. LeCh32-8]|uniref:efflux transporter outer membrane subunit n=1 Tax=Herbaspirillum sp. LeCh32-8 TaxID=2821356 RepID=UPI001AE5FC60|nr:efflux transporter outer membrane subunit [Herbaspirillum sp. LeCh32-8]MBP0598540.1 efflux transporter outer membrane subunit [Herbaspirillum sp. LeCh32-8]